MNTHRLAILVVICLAVVVRSAHALSNNHLECFKIKDNIPKATYTVDQAFESGCIVKVPAKLFCTATPKTNVSPTPPGGGPNLNLNEGLFFCYKEKCPKVNFPYSGLKDQFGTHTNVSFTGSTKLLCAPASPSGAFLDDSPGF